MQSELLTFASKYDKATLRVMHVGGGHVFPNWPTSQTPLGKVECCAFSPGSGLCATGSWSHMVKIWSVPDCKQVAQRRSSSTAPTQ